MISDLVSLFVLSVFISLVTFGGGSQALFYQFGVSEQHWITSNDLSSVLAFGYATPGPAVFGTAAFIGYNIAGIPGAFIGALGIFIMPFALATIAAKYLGRFVDEPHVHYFIKGVGLAAAGIVAATAFNVLEVHPLTFAQVVIIVCSLIASLKYKINPLFILIAGGLLGFII
jgi:chromate transporter